MKKSPRFDPRPDDPGFATFRNRDENVVGVVDITELPKLLTIYEWSSRVGGRGNTRRALEELKKAAKKIAVIGIGSAAEDPSWQYWLHMCREGLVDYLYDDYNRRVPCRRRTQRTKSGS